MEELIKRLERVIQTGVPDKDGMHPISAEAVLEVVKEQLGMNLAEVGTDCISRQAAIDALAKFVPYAICDESTESYTNGLTDAYNLILQLPSAQPEQSIAEWQKDFREYINMLNIPRDDYKGIMEYINEVPSAQPVQCEDAVSRETLLKFFDGWMSALDENCHNQSVSDLKIIKRDFANLPPVTPKQRTGKWIKTARWRNVYKCDKCGNYLDFSGVNAGRGDANFCPNCGADMRGEKDG